jgi:hypothetical protein
VRGIRAQLRRARRRWCRLLSPRRGTQSRRLVGWNGRPEIDRPYDESTLQLVFSTTKGATRLRELADARGQLGHRCTCRHVLAGVRRCRQGEHPVRWLLCHKAGLPVVDKRLSLGEALSGTRSLLRCRSGAGVGAGDRTLSALTYGWLVGRSHPPHRRPQPRHVFAEEIAQPLGLEFWIGCQRPRSIGSRHSSAPSSPGSPNEELRALVEQFMGPDSVLGRALTLTTHSDGMLERARRACGRDRAANGITNARSVRALRGLWPDPGRRLRRCSRPRRSRPPRRQTEGADRCLFFETSFGLGFFTASMFAPYGGADLSVTRAGARWASPTRQSDRRGMS